MIKLFTDSTSYLPVEYLEENEIGVIPLKVVVDGKEYYENKISNNSFYSAIREDKKIPKSLPVSVKDAETAFENEVVKGNQVIAVFLSSKVSDSYKHACEARDNVLKRHQKAKIEIIDSQATAMQEGFVVMAAAEKIKQNSWFEEVVDAARENLDHTRFLFVPDNLEFMRIGGKINAFQAMFGGLIKLIPIIMPRDGEIKLLETVRTKKNAIERSLELMKSDIDKCGAKQIVINHIDSYEEASAIADKVNEIADVEVGISDVGPVIGANLGPGAIGITYETIRKIPRVEAV